MSRDLPTDYYNSTWLEVGRFSKISTTEDGQREFLEAIQSFMFLKHVTGIPPEGMPMPNVGQITVGNISDISYIPDKPITNDAVVDGKIIVKQVN